MAKVEMDPPFRHFRGRIGGLVYRRNGDGTSVGRPSINTKPLTEAQTQVRDQFRAAAAYAKAVMADPVLGPRYTEAALTVGQRPQAFALADYMKEPVVDSIRATAYRGRIGDPILVFAHDDFELTGVSVSMRSAADVEFEQGEAVLTNGAWRYITTTVVPAGTPVIIEATAVDRPGNTGSLRTTLVVA